ncbi:MAG: Xaa-Pro aminopeptidase [Kiritimatiellia bacterium]|jgi:Xaa-Pro aminopeptidase
MRPVLDFEDHRERLLQQLGSDEALLIFGGHHHLRNGDAEYRYRPNSDLYWLTGWPDPDVALFVKHGDHPFQLFVQPKNEAMEIWTGFRPGPQGAVEQYGADAAHDIGELADHLIEALQGVRVLHYAFAEDADNDRMLTAAIRKASRKARKTKATTPAIFHHPSVTLHELRLHKADDEVQVMKEAARITTLAHKASMSLAAPGVGEWELDALIEYTFKREGANGPAYTNIVAGGANACVLHYITNDRVLKDGDLVLIDAGAEFGCYASDVTRTFPVNGTFSPPQRRVYEIVLRAMQAAIDAVQVGVPFERIHQVATRSLVEGLKELGLIEGDTDEIIDKGEHRKYYMHGTSHWLGLDVHDVGVYHGEGESRPLAEGMVLTVEPGLYIPANDIDAPAELRGIGVRIEDDILVTASGPYNLTAAIPKSIDDVEAACRA